MTRVRLTAPERREQIVGASLRRFAKGGPHGTSTEAVADDVELSQPYLFLYERLIAEGMRLSGADAERAYAFFGIGTLLNVATTLGFDRVVAAFKDA